MREPQLLADEPFSGAEAVFTAQQTLADAQAFYADPKRRAATATPHRRDPP